MIEKIRNLLASDECTHILYAYQDRERYLNNAITYTLEGIEMGETVILIENERNINELQKRLNRQLSPEQLERVHPISNFDFYQSSGSYHPPAIYEQLMRTITPYLENKVSFRSWTNVEWGTLEDPGSIIEWFETETDRVVHEHNLTVVCAYDSEKMPDHLEDALKKNHGHLMSDEDIVTSIIYSKPIRQ